jgi:sialic acid synthase SpsE
MSVFIIAEIGNTHEGSVGLAKQFIKTAANCGVDAVKFQTHIFEAESTSYAPNPPYFNLETRKEYFERTSFNIYQYKILKKFTEEECGIEFLSSPFSIEAVDLLLELGIKTIKIPSGEVTNLPLLEYISKTGKKVLLSSGMSTWEELDDAVAVFKDKNELIVLQCTSEYPCPPENSGVNLLSEIRDRYQTEVGFSDHTLGIAVPILSVALGARVIEKHFTLSRQMYGADASNSIEPDELSILVQGIRDAYRALGSKINKNEKADELTTMKVVFEKSIVAKHDLITGHRITFEDLAFKKPGGGIPAKRYKDLVGRILVKPLKKDTQFEFNQFK